MKKQARESPIGQSHRRVVKAHEVPRSGMEAPMDVHEKNETVYGYTKRHSAGWIITDDTKSPSLPRWVVHETDVDPLGAMYSDQNMTSALLSSDYSIGRMDLL